MLSVVMLMVIILNVIAECRYTECRNTECRGTAIADTGHIYRFTGPVLENVLRSLLNPNLSKFLSINVS
jgi:hypothetical protein